MPDKDKCEAKVAKLEAEVAKLVSAVRELTDPKYFPYSDSKEKAREFLDAE